MTDPVLEARKRLLARLTSFMEKHPEGVTVRQISKGVSISIDLLCELLTEVKAEVKGELWTLPKEQPKEEINVVPSVEPALTINRQQPIKETTVSNSTQNQPKSQAMQESALMKLTKSLESQLSILSNTGLSAERLEMELRRADGIAKIVKQMTDVGRLVLDANKFEAEFGKGRVDSNLLSMG